MIVKCTKCHHEWQTTAILCQEPWHHADNCKCSRVCDWCGATGEKIANDWMDREREGLVSRLSSFIAAVLLAAVVALLLW